MTRGGCNTRLTAGQSQGGEGRGVGRWHPSVRRQGTAPAVVRHCGIESRRANVFPSGVEPLRWCPPVDPCYSHPEPAEAD